MMDWHNYISIDPKVLAGKPVIAGTRISVQLILELLAEGASDAEITAAYPHINEKQIHAACAFAAAALSADDLILADQPAA